MATPTTPIVYDTLCCGAQITSFLGTGITISEFRDLALMLVAIIGVFLAIRRISIANRQAIASEGQLNSAREAALNEQFKVGIELLANPTTTVRTGGVQVLADLARTNPYEYHMRVIDIFVGLLMYPPRKPTPSGGVGETDFESSVLVTTMAAMNTRTETQKGIERRNQFFLGERLRDTDFELHLDNVRPRNI